jgi:hypothetical protein
MYHQQEVQNASKDAVRLLLKHVEEFLAADVLFWLKSKRY